MLKPSPLAGTENRRNDGGENYLPAPSFLTDVLPSEDADSAEPGDYDGYGSGCGRMTAYLSAFLDGELDRDTQNRVEIHLDSCPQCAAHFDALLAADSLIQREWRDNAPLPSPSEVRIAVDAIMDALPPVPAAAHFAPKRVHARARWIRFATGVAGVMALLMGLLWSSYRIGYEQGRLSILPNPAPNPTVTPSANPAPRRTETSRLSPAFTLPAAFRCLPVLPAFPPPSLFPAACRAVRTA